MRHRRLVFLLLVVFCVAAGVAFALYQFNLSALKEPGQVETYVATKAKRWIVSRNAGGPLPPGPANDAASLANGRMLYTGSCANCHGLDGRTPTDIGRWMYPRSPNLGSPAVQQWSDAELFWIIKHGVRLSGMPGFGKIHSDEQIRHLVHYVRTLGTPPKG